MSAMKWRGLPAVAVLAVAAAAVGTGLAVPAAAAPRAPADPPLGACTAGTIFNVAGSQQTGASVGADAGNLYSLDVTTGANTLIGRFSSGSTPVNGLGVTHNLSAAYAVAQNAAAGGQQIYTFANDGATSATTNAPNTGLTLVMGAVDPANGIYYYGGYTGSGATLTVAIYGYNPATNTPLGRLVNVSLAGTGFSTGDFAFDGKGNLFIVAGTNSTTAANTSQIRRVDGPLPASGPAVTLPSTTLATKTAPAGSGFYNGVAFAANGTLYAQYATSGSGTGTGATPGTATLQALDPGNAATLAAIPQTGVPVGNSIFTDLAGCSLPGTLTLRKDLPGGRARPQDQFRMEITGGDIAEGNSVTTTGAAAGLQGQEVGPLPAVPSTVYTISESLAPGSASSLSDYTSAWSCANTTTSAAVASGHGTSGTFTFPALAAGAVNGDNVVCTFTNEPGPPGISIAKSAYPRQYGEVGEEITYTYTVTNTGEVTLHDITVTDDRISGPVTCEQTTLAPGESTTCEAVYTITEPDIEAGDVVNTAIATGHPPAGTPVTDDDTDTVRESHGPGIEIEKTAFPTQYVMAGEQITYTYTVVNTGNRTLHGVTVTDSRLGPVSCPSTTLAPGESMTCHATHTTTAADVAAGQVPNAAFVTGDPPTGTPVTDDDTETIHAIHRPGIQIQKTASPGTFGAAGQPVTFTYRVVNTGNATLRRITVTDSRVGRVSCPSTTLAPGAAMTCYATYITTAADVAAGHATNVAAATGYPPTGPPVTGYAEAIVTLLPIVPVTG